MKLRWSSWIFFYIQKVFNNINFFEFVTNKKQNFNHASDLCISF